ncbi:hypothetical protein MMC17_004980 [Xylographa soralifera]|nr:hypothetical protein [Xylographa soralifera]
MPPTDYTATPGGSLKLKGAPPGAKITKHKKKKKRPDQPLRTDSSANHPAEQAPENPSGQDGDDGDEEREKRREEEEHEEDGGPKITGVGVGAGKTEAERRYEAQRRKRLDERLKREGVKTHKERVEELNRYLSNLSRGSDRDNLSCWSGEWGLLELAYGVLDVAGLMAVLWSDTRGYSDGQI